MAGAHDGTELSSEGFKDLAEGRFCSELLFFQHGAALAQIHDSTTEKYFQLLQGRWFTMTEVGSEGSNRPIWRVLHERSSVVQCSADSCQILAHG